MNKDDKIKFDTALDEAFEAVVLGKIEDVTNSLKNFTERIEQEVNANRSATGSSEPEDLNHGLDHLPIG